MTAVRYIYRTSNNSTGATTSYKEATEGGNRIARTIYEKVSDPEDEKAVDYLVNFWRKHR